MSAVRYVILAGWLTTCIMSAAMAEDARWQEVDRLDEELDQVEHELRVNSYTLEVLREGVPSDADEALAAARKALEEAEAEQEKAFEEAGLIEMREKLRAAQKARDDKAEEVLSRGERFPQVVARFEEISKQIEDMTGRIEKLSLAEARTLAKLRLEERHLGRQLYYGRRARWEHPEVKSLFQEAGKLYHAYGRAKKKMKDMRKQVKRARRNLEKARENVELSGEAAATVLAERAALETKQKALESRLDALRNELLSGAKEYHLTVPMPPKKGKPRKPEKITLWVPPNCDYIRGVIAAAPQFGKFAKMRVIREAAARADLATMVLYPFPYNGQESLKRLDEALDKLAEKSGHNELRGAPVLTAGLSASVIAARNMAYVAPDRVFGVVQVAGGNMHHHVPAGTSLSGVPFIAMNGELEWCGPEGGLRPEYGRQTQWLMIREQLLRRWQSDHNHLISLVVVPGGDHCAWDSDLAAMFVRKAAEYRIPKERRDGTTPAKLLKIDPRNGWLTDADLDNPKNPAAAFDQYTGDKEHVFWHFDEEMAKAVEEYHKDKFILPDPTKEHPVPEDWPPKRR